MAKSVSLAGLLSCARCLGGPCLQHKFLHAPGFDLSNDNLVRVAAIHHMHHLEPAEFLAGMTELAEDRPIQFHLVDLARRRPCAWGIAVGIGVGGEDVLMRALRYTN